MTKVKTLGIWVCLGAVLTSGFYVRGQEVVVRKQAGRSNPPLFVDSFVGSETVRAGLVRTLQFSDWFDVTTDRAEARYILRGRFTQAARPVLDLELWDAAGQRVSGFRLTSRSSRTERLVFRAVDKLIQDVFHVTGPCATRIAFTAASGRGKEIFTCNFDGTDMRQITHNNSISTEPSWGPGAATMVYTLYGPSYTDVILLDLVNRRQRRLSQFPGLNAGADLSPDGRQAALCLSRDGTVDLYVMRLDDGALRRVTRDRAVDASPCWSPDGRALCFVSDRAGRPRLFVVGSAGGTPERVTRSAYEEVSPDWSKTSNRICFSMRKGGRYVVAVVDPTDPGRGVRVVTPAPGDWEAPSWAPDGRHIVCTRTVGGRSTLTIVDSWYERAIPISSPGRFGLPNWSDPF